MICIIGLRKPAAVAHITGVSGLTAAIDGVVPVEIVEVALSMRQAQDESDQVHQTNQPVLVPA